MPSTGTSAADPPSAAHVGGVVVVGGGYAGLHAARALSKAGVPVTILDTKGTHNFVTRLAAVAGGTSPTSDASVDLHQFHDSIRIGTVVGVGDGTLDLIDGATLTADAVIVTAGAQPSEPPIDGIEHALPLRTANDALAIRTALSTADHLIIVGGGPTGVQLAGAVAATHSDVTVTIADSAERLLASMSEPTSRGAARILEERGVRVTTQTEIDEITAEGAKIDGELVRGIVVWAGGFEPRTDQFNLDVSADGRILVDDQLRVLGTERTFAAGDIAAHLDEAGDFLPMSAQIAVQAGTAAGENAAALFNGGELSNPKLVQRGWVLDLGGHRGLAEFGPVKLSAPFADLLPPLLHKLIDLKTLYGSGGLTALRY